MIFVREMRENGGAGAVYQHRSCPSAHDAERSRDDMPSTDSIPYGYCQCGCGRRTSISTKNHPSRGQRKGEPARYLPGHNKRVQVSDYATRFWSKVSPGDARGCMTWVGGVGRNGYGRFAHSARMTRAAHRVAWELTRGDIPPGRIVCHHCDRPLCCNPAHLFLGTHQDNMDDMVRKGRARGRSFPAQSNPMSAESMARRAAAAPAIQKRTSALLRE